MGFFQNRFFKPVTQLYAPMAGRVVALGEVPDEAFGAGMLGDGIAIVPRDGRVYAPCDGVVDSLFPSGHALSLIARGGAEILIHVGLDTVSLGGVFSAYVTAGQRVRRGQLLLEADLAAILAAGRNPVTPMVVCNTQRFSAVRTHIGGVVTNGDLVMELRK